MAPRENAPQHTRQAVAASRKEEALWLLERLVPGSNVNNVPGATVRVEGRLDQTLLLASVNALLHRHPVLRTVYHAEDTTLLKEVLPAERAVLPLESRQLPETELDAALLEFVVRTFPLDGSPLVRLACFSTETADVLCLAVHHLVFDSTSSTVFLEELAVVYDLAAAGQDLTTLPVEEVPTWEERSPDGKSLAFWRSRLDGFDPDSGELWIGNRPAGSGTLAGDRLVHSLSPASSAVLRGAQRTLRAPDSVVLLAVYYLLLARHGAGPDLTVGLPVNIRDQKARRTIGYHVNILPLRSTVDPALSFGDFVRQIRDAFLEAVAHADAPVDVLLPEAPRIEATWRSALFRHVFNFLPGRGTREYRIGGMSGRLEVVETGSSKFDLEFLIVPIGEGYEVKAIYSTDVHTPEEVQLLLHRYDALLAALGADPDLTLGQVSAWSAADHEVIDAARAEAPASLSAGLVPALTARVCDRPDAVAVEEPSRTTSYRQLWQAALATRELLLEQGIGTDDVVGVCAAPGAELVAAALGVWLAGATYAALEPDATAVEVAAARVKAVLAAPGAPQAASAVCLPLVGLDDPQFPHQLLEALDPRSGACTTPSGGVLTHSELAALLAHFAETLPTAPGPVDALWRAPLAGAAALPEVWLPLATGGRIVLVPGREALPEALDAHPGALLQARPADWWTLLGTVEGRVLDRPVLVGPEPLTRRLAERLLSAGARLHSVRGAAGALWGSARVHDADRQAPEAVRPFAGLHASVVAPDGTELPVGVRGEIHLATGGRAVPSGALGRWTGQGTLEITGELGRRLRRRGGTVQPEQVEALLAEHPQVAAVAAVALDGPHAEPDGPALVAVVQRVPGLRQDDPLLVAELLALAAAGLPRSALPDRITVVAELPTARDGSLDRTAIAGTAARALTAAEGEGPAETALGHLPLLLTLWRELIGRDDLDADSNFFTSGGHSLLAAQLVQQVGERTGVRLRLADAFEHPTPSAMAARLAVVAGAA